MQCRDNDWACQAMLTLSTFHVSHRVFKIFLIQRLPIMFNGSPVYLKICKLLLFFGNSHLGTSDLRNNMVELFLLLILGSSRKSFSSCVQCFHVPPPEVSMFSSSRQPNQSMRAPLFLCNVSAGKEVKGRFETSVFCPISWTVYMERYSISKHVKNRKKYL